MPTVAQEVNKNISMNGLLSSVIGWVAELYSKTLTFSFSSEQYESIKNIQNFLFGRK